MSLFELNDDSNYTNDGDDDYGGGHVMVRVVRSPPKWTRQVRRTIKKTFMNIKTIIKDIILLPLFADVS